MKIKHKLFCLLALAFGTVVVGWSCSSDYFNNNDRVIGDDVELNMQIALNTKSDGKIDHESTLRSIRVMIFVSTESTSAGIPPGFMLINKRYDDLETIPSQRFSPGLRDMYIVANETQKMRAKLDQVRTVSQLHAIHVEYDPDAPSAEKPFVMCAEQLKEQFSGGATANILFKLLRVAAKASFELTFNATTTTIDAGLKNKSLVVESIKIMQISDSTTLSSDAPVYAPQKHLESHLATFTQPVDPQKWTIRGEQYLTERLFATAADRSDPELATYMMVFAKLDGAVCHYRINIGDGASKNTTPKNYTISRNTHYNINGTITKLGEMDGVDVEIDVVEWGKIPINGNVGQFVGFDKYINYREDQTIVEPGENISIYCSTNIGGWYTITKDGDGNLINRSAKTNIVESTHSQNVAIAIPSLPGNLEKRNITVAIYHPFLAPEGGDPIKSIDFEQITPTVTIADIKWVTANLEHLSYTKRPESYGLFYKWASNAAYERVNVHPGFSAAVEPRKSSTNGMGYDYVGGDPCQSLGTKYRTPTREQFTMLYNTCKRDETHTMQYLNGISGFFFGPKALNIVTPQTSVPNGMIFLPTAGLRGNEGLFNTQYGYYWTSTATIYYSDPYSYFFGVAAGFSFTSDTMMLRWGALSVRCIKE